MTNQEAIGYLEHLYEEVEDAEDLNHALNIAIEAIEKQIETLPRFEGPTNLAQDDIEAYCPKCNYYIEVEISYCPDCGQKILWP